MTILDRLEQLLPLASRSTFRQMLRDRRISVNGLAVTSLKEPLREEDVLRVGDKKSTPRARAAARAERRENRPPVETVFEDADLFVINKPQGIITSSGPRDSRVNLFGLLRAFYQKREPRARIGLVHRLDADAGGLMVFSKNEPTFADLKRQFASHSVERVYVALLDGVPKTPAGTIDTKLVETRRRQSAIDDSSR